MANRLRGQSFHHFSARFAGGKKLTLMKRLHNRKWKDKVTPILNGFTVCSFQLSQKSYKCQQSLGKTRNQVKTWSSNKQIQLTGTLHQSAHVSYWLLLSTKRQDAAERKENHIHLLRPCNKPAKSSLQPGLANSRKKNQLKENLKKSHKLDILQMHIYPLLI